MRNKTRQGKKQNKLGKKAANKSFSIFNDDKTTTGTKKPERKKQHQPLITVEQRNELLRSLNSGEEIEIKC